MNNLGLSLMFVVLALILGFNVQQGSSLSMENENIIVNQELNVLDLNQSLRSPDADNLFVTPFKCLRTGCKQCAFCCISAGKGGGKCTRKLCQCYRKKV